MDLPTYGMKVLLKEQYRDNRIYSEYSIESDDVRVLLR